MIFSEKLIIQSRFPEHIATGQDLFDLIEHISDELPKLLSYPIVGVFLYNRQHLEEFIVCEVEKDKFISYGHSDEDDRSFWGEEELKDDWRLKRFNFSYKAIISTVGLAADTIITLEY